MVSDGGVNEFAPASPGQKPADFTENQAVWERLWAIYSEEEDDELLLALLREDRRTTRLPGKMNRCQCPSVHLLTCPIVQRQTHNRVAVRSAVAKARGLAA